MKEKGKQTLVGIFYMLFILSVSVIVTLGFKPLYYQDIDRLEIEKQSGLSREEIIENYNILIDYNLNPFIEKLEFKSLPMSETGGIHFVEVKRIFTALEVLAVGSLIVAVLGTVNLVPKKRLEFLLVAGGLSIIVPVVLGALVALNWETFFVTFHHIFFQNDYWIFDAATDPVITILPDTFFLHCAIMILAGILVGAAICIGVYFNWKRLENKKVC